MVRHGLSRTGNQQYRHGYSRSPAWFARRDRWFEQFAALHGWQAYCYVCEMSKTQLGGLDLHHVSYDGVGRDHRNRWVAHERYEDLVPMCRSCHDDLHARLDDGKTYYGWSRENATFRIIADLRMHLAHDPGKQRRLRDRAVDSTT